MSATQPVVDQIRFLSTKTGIQQLDAYLEACERNGVNGAKTLSDLLALVFDANGGIAPPALQYRTNPSTGELQFRSGVFADPNIGWNNTGTFVFRDRGAHANGTAYERLDLVTYNNQVFFCNTPHTSNTAAPGANFTLAVNQIVPILTGAGDALKFIQANAGGTAYTLLDAAATRTALGLGTAATKNTGVASGDVPLVGTASATETLPGLAELLNQAEMDAGTDDARAATAKKIHQLLARALEPGGRLTLATGTPVMTSNISGASAATLYYAIYTHDKIGLYDATGSVWRLYTFTERSASLTGLTADLPHDVFIYDNAGTLTLDVVAWTNDTTRATALVRQDGIWVKTGALGRRYLGTIATRATGQSEWTPAPATDTEARLLVWNFYNRVDADAIFKITANWSSSAVSLRPFNNSANARIRYVCGLVEDSLIVSAVLVLGYVSANVIATLGIGHDSTSVDQTPEAISGNPSSTTTRVPISNTITLKPGVGRHFICPLEAFNAAGVDVVSAFIVMQWRA